ncbi:MAG: tetratricopeptide repeat protein [Actinomycetota bacterium]|nr:tetratricopeptide repeat protein [Actinomycetota bacterium]
MKEGHPERLPALLPHLRTVADAAFEREDEQAAALCITLGTHLRMVGVYEEAESYLRRSLGIAQNLYGEEHVKFARGLFNLANLQQVQGKYEAARSSFRQALAIGQKELGEWS